MQPVAHIVTELSFAQCKQLRFGRRAFGRLFVLILLGVHQRDQREL